VNIHIMRHLASPSAASFEERSMKPAVVLFVTLGYCALVLTNATAQKAQKPAAAPKPSPTARPAATQTPAAARPVPTATPAPTAKPSPTQQPSPTPAARAATASAAKEPCESKVLASGIPLCSRTQPATSVLDKDAAQSRAHKPAPPDKPAEPVAFTHEAHAKQKYSVDGTKVIGCTECHHTDQPKTSLSGVLKTSQRDVLLTTAALAAPGAAPVLSCRACHAQAGRKPAVCDDAQMAAKYAFCPSIPKATYEEEGEVEQTNEEAYHHNCINCHSDAVAARKKPGAPPFIKGAPPTNCSGCHKGS
jgi:hypothetical protein